MPMPDVPIIGQPRVGNWFFCVQVICPCGGAVLLVGQMGSKSQCPGSDCGRVYTLTGLPTMTDSGNISVPLGMGIPVKTAPQ